MAVLQVFDPPMCCSTGVCGPNVNPALIRFAADLQRLQEQGVRVERFNLAQEPGEFAQNPIVGPLLAEIGTGCLPLVLVDGVVVSRGGYPSREELIAVAGVGVQRTADRTRVSAVDQATADRRSSLSQNGGGGCCGGSECCG